MGFLKKLKDSAEKGIEKGTDLGKQGIEKGTELGKQGIDLSKKGVEKIDEIREEQKQTDDKVIQKFLEPNEKILYSVSQKRSSSGNIRPKTIIVTDRQILRKSYYLMKPVINTWKWDELSRLRYIPSLLSYTLVISPFGARNEEIEGLPKKETMAILDYGKKKITTNKPVSNSVDSEDPLTTLKIRFAKGEISKEEYEEMKQILE